MSKLFILIYLFLILVIPTAALEISPPDVPESGSSLMPEETSVFSDAIAELFQNALHTMYPNITESFRISVCLIFAVVLLSLLQSFSGPSKRTAVLAAVTIITSMLLKNTGSLIHLSAQTVTELSEYGKLLLAVMTTGLAAQGALATSSALYAGTAAFDTVLSNLISAIIIPMVYVFLILSSCANALEEDTFNKLRDFIKWCISWSLKTTLTIYTAYISITGVISGTTDAIALKATKMTISSVVPVVGGILSEAADTILISAGFMKNAAGIYGVLAVLAIFLTPFLRIGIFYCMLKVTAFVCGLFGSKPITNLIQDFSTAMGFLLAMTGSVCLLLLISTVCFMKGAS